MAKFTHHISCPCGSTDSRRREGDRRELVSGFLAFPLFSASHPVCVLSNRQALISVAEDVDRRESLATLTQLVRLIKRFCGLWVRAQKHQETGDL